ALTLAVLRSADEYLGTLAPQTEVAVLRKAVQQAIAERAEGGESKLQQPSYWSWDGTQASLGATGVDVTALERPSAEGLLRGARLGARACTPDQAQALQADGARAASGDCGWV